MLKRRWAWGWIWGVVLVAGCPFAPAEGQDAGGKPSAPVHDAGGGHGLEDAGGDAPKGDAGEVTPEEDGGLSPREDAGSDDAGWTPEDDAGSHPADDAGFDAGPLVCEPHFADCDLDPDNGCETPIDTEANCGACGVPCAPENATGDCSSGTCQIATCAAGFGDCDGDPSNGCETPLNTLSDCGQCGEVCAPDNATGDCSSGTCQIATCEAGFGDCDGDPENGCETPLNTLSDCGECGKGCTLAGATGDCSSGICELEECHAGFGDCDGDPENGCETLLTTTTDCGTCGIPCNPVGGEGDCSTGTCQIASCSPGAGDCDGNPVNGCETNLRTNANCGGCGITCSHEKGISACASGNCQLIGCVNGYGNCDGDDANGCEQRLDTMEHCGACGNACTFPNGYGTCSSEGCQLVGCEAGWSDCDGDPSNGCEQRLDTLEHCGACDTGCSLAHADETCSSGSCQVESCDSLWGNCDGNHANGCETSLETTTDCGSCGQPCSFPNANASCAGGVCTMQSCKDGYSNCDGSSSNGCERRHSMVSGSCGGGTDVGSFRADTWCGTPGICWTEATWHEFASREGRNSTWYRARAVEEDYCSTPLEHRIKLEVPSGIDYDLYVYRSCGTLIASSKNGAGQNESVTIKQAENDDHDDSFNYYVEVRYYSGRSCSPFKITFEGRSC